MYNINKINEEIKENKEKYISILDMINEKCPNGVEYQPLWKVTVWDKKFKSVDKYKQSKIIKYKYYLANEIKELISNDGTIKILTTYKSNLKANEKDVKNTISEGEIVCIPWGGNPIVQYYKGKFITSDNRIATSIDRNILDNKYLYYYLQNNIETISSYYRGSAIKHPNMAKVLDIKIPLPPIEIQREIVKILDQFEELEKELEKELKMRIDQYEYYRDKLLTFDDSVERKKLGDVTNIMRGKRVTKKEILKEGLYPVISGGVNEMGRYNSYNREANTITISQYGTAGYVNFQKEKFWANDVCYCIYLNEELNNRYLYFCLKNLQEHFYTIRTKAIPYCLPLIKLEETIISIPPLEVQQKIADTLDQFDELCTSLTNGIPAEIEMRKEQYEYYRNLLLNFKNINENDDLTPLSVKFYESLETQNRPIKQNSNKKEDEITSFNFSDDVLKGKNQIKVGLPTK